MLPCGGSNSLYQFAVLSMYSIDAVRVSVCQYVVHKQGHVNIKNLKYINRHKSTWKFSLKDKQLFMQGHTTYVVGLRALC